MRALLPIAVLCASLWGSAGYAYFSLDVASPPIIEVARSSVATLIDRRRIPSHAKRGYMSPPVGRQVMVDGEAMVLAPGVKIYDLRNRIVLPYRLQRYYYVQYTVDRSQQIARIWIDSDQSTPKPPRTPPDK